MRLPAPLSALWEPLRVRWLSAWMPPIRVAEPAFPLRATGGLLSLPRIALHSGRGGYYPVDLNHTALVCPTRTRRTIAHFPFGPRGSMVSGRQMYIVGIEPDSVPAV